jgi:hypothetical protein
MFSEGTSLGNFIGKGSLFRAVFSIDTPRLLDGKNLRDTHLFMRTNILI